MRQNYSFLRLALFYFVMGLASLEVAIAQISSPNEFTREYLQQIFRTEPRVDSLADAARELFNIIEKEQRFLDRLTGKELISLPIGLKKRLSPNSTLSLGVYHMRWHPEYTEIDLFARLTLGEVKGELVFAAHGIKISHEGGFLGEARLVLLKDVSVIQQGGRWLLTFLGGLKTNGRPAEESYISIDCEGNLTRVALFADVRISKGIALPLKDDGSLMYPNQTTPGNGESPINNKSYVGARLRVDAGSLTDFILQADLPMFQIQGLPGWGFRFRECLLDLSDTQNAPGFTLPKWYQDQSFLPRDQQELWRGFYAASLEVMLPAEFRSRTEERITIGARSLLIDHWGVSGDIFASQVLPLREGRAGKWQFSVDSLSLSLAAGRFAKASFTGAIVLPIASKTGDTLGALNYKGMISNDQRYSLQVGIDKELDLSILKAKAKFLPGSYIGLEAEAGTFYPEARLSGLMTFGAGEQEAMDSLPRNSKGNIDLSALELEGLHFRDLHLQSREAPYLSLGAAGFGDTIATPKLYGFRMGIHNVDFTSKKETAELAFNAFLHLDNTGIKGDVRLAMEASVSDGDLLEYTYQKTRADAVHVAFERKGFELEGKLEFFRDHARYGKGMRGSLQVSSQWLKMDMSARAVFGVSDSLNYWYADLHGRPLRNEQKHLRVHDLGGGLYYHMRRAGMEETGEDNPSGLTYVPDAETGMGFRILASFELKQAATFTGLTAVEMSFNSPAQGGGVRTIGFYGAAALMRNRNNSFEAPFGSVEEVQEKLSTREQALRGMPGITIDRKGVQWFAKEVFPNVLTGEEHFAAQLAFDYDFVNDIQWGMMDVFLNVGGIRGDGENNRLGYLEFYNSPQDWYLYVGTPDRRFGVRDIPVGIFKARMNLYFMTGSILPDPAAPPANVIDLLNLRGDELLFNRYFDQQLAEGRGYAFGAEFALGIGLDWGMIYASAEAGVGFDLLMRDFGEAQCRGNEEMVGINGWYASGQLYAYLQGRIGVRFSMFGISIDVPILQAGLAVLAQGQMPSPWFIKGYAGVKVRALGVTVKARLKVVIGEECEIIERNGLENYRVITDIEPYQNSTDISVFTAVKASFGFPVGKFMTVEDGVVTRKYRVDLDGFELKEGNKKIKGEITWNEEGDILTFTPDDVLPGNTDLIVRVQVGFSEYKFGEWKKVTRNGIPVIEEERITFRTAGTPSFIPLDNIASLYPVINQKFLLPGESEKGFIHLIRGQEIPAEAKSTEKLYLKNLQTNTREQIPFTYDKTNNRYRFDLPELQTSQAYEIALTMREASDSTDGAHRELVRLEYGFTTSKYTHFKDKIQAIHPASYITFSDGASEVAGMAVKTSEMEPFDIHEIAPTRFNEGVPFIKGEGLEQDAYFKREIHPLIYRDYPQFPGFVFQRTTGDPEFQPRQAIMSSAAYTSLAKSGTQHAYMQDHFPFHWRLSAAYHRDFRALQAGILSLIFVREEVQPSQYAAYKHLLDARFPYINTETYKVQFEYVVPGTSGGKKARFDYINHF